MTTRPPPSIAADGDTFDMRWDRWVREGIRRDRILHKRAVGALIVLASTAMLATVWLVAFQ